MFGFRSMTPVKGTSMRLCKELLSVLALLLVCGVLNGFPLSADEAVSQSARNAGFHNSFNHFITHSGSRLLDGAQNFRFISIELPVVHRNEDDVLPNGSDRWTNTYEIKDQLEAFRQAGGTATRIMPPSEGPDPLGSDVLGLGKYNETAFRAMDRMLEIANEKHVRIIVPLIDEHAFWGGLPMFASWCGVTTPAIPNTSGFSCRQFYASPRCIAEYERLINYVLDRRNSYTGIRYKDDPTILAWQIGNEMDSDNAQFESTIAAYIKSIDHNHLVMSGTENTLQDLDDPNVDILSTHIYQYWSSQTNLAGICRRLKQRIGDKKVLIVDECGMGDTQNIVALYNEVIQDGTAGCILWSFRGHDRNGGFRFHGEGGGYQSYHWPGFSFDEKALLAATRAAAYRIRNLPVPALPAPAAPTLLPIANPGAIYWQGSVGAQRYEIDRAPSAHGSWTTLSTSVSDDVTYPTPEYIDATALPGTHYCYRVRAINSSGASGYSNIVALSSTP